jgi:hypothetical protein
MSAPIPKGTTKDGLNGAAINYLASMPGAGNCASRVAKLLKFNGLRKIRTAIMDSQWDTSNRCARPIDDRSRNRCPSTTVDHYGRLQHKVGGRGASLWLPLDGEPDGGHPDTAGHHGKGNPGECQCQRRIVEMPGGSALAIAGSCDLSGHGRRASGSSRSSRPPFHGIGGNRVERVFAANRSTTAQCADANPATDVSSAFLSIAGGSAGAANDPFVNGLRVEWQMGPFEDPFWCTLGRYGEFMAKFNHQHAKRPEKQPWRSARSGAEKGA